MPHGVVTSVSRSKRHGVGKQAAPAITLVEGEGVEGDAHRGARVQHRSVARWRPHQPNLRQVHLIAAELLDELAALGLALEPGEMGENVTTRGLDLLALPTGARLRLGAVAVVELTGLRKPCVQLERLRAGLLAAVTPSVKAYRAGVMSVVVTGGEVRRGDPIALELPFGPTRPLGPV